MSKHAQARTYIAYAQGMANGTALGVDDENIKYNLTKISDYLKKALDLLEGDSHE